MTFQTVQISIALYGLSPFMLTALYLRAPRFLWYKMTVIARNYGVLRNFPSFKAAFNAKRRNKWLATSNLIR